MILTCTIVGIVVTFFWHIIDYFLIPGMVREKIDQLRRDLTMQAMMVSPGPSAA